MSVKKIIAALSLSVVLPYITESAYAQMSISTTHAHGTLQHAIEQYHNGHYELANQSLKHYVEETGKSFRINDLNVADYNHRIYVYYQVLLGLKIEGYEGEKRAIYYVDNVSDNAFKQRAAFALAQHYFHTDQHESAIKYYEIAGIDNLTNDEIAEAKFELAYSYFVQNKLQESKSLFASIKELEKNKYYIASNYYYGLIAYNDKEYDKALKSFKRLENIAAYEEVVPYYLAEIYYFQGDKNKAFDLADKYLKKNKAYFYNNEMHLLKAQINFEKERYKDAIPDFEAYFNNSEKVSKEVYYEHAYSYYKIKDYTNAAEKFKPLSTTKDSLGQTAMYLLGDCYLNMKNKSDARTAFGVASNMDFMPKVQQDATFLYGQLSYELGDEANATKALYTYVNKFPDGGQSNQAKSLLSNLLLKNSNYAEAYKLLKDVTPTDKYMRSIKQQVLVGRSLQLVLDKDYAQADALLDEALTYPESKQYDAVAKFWISEIAYEQQRYQDAVKYGQEFLGQAKGNEDIIRKISSNATVANAQANIGFAQMELGDYAAANQQFTAAASQKTLNDDERKDLLVRKADALFMNKSYDEADKAYQEAIQQKVTESDYAYLQRAKIAGLNDNHEQKIKLLEQVVRNKNSTWYETALLEIGAANIEIEAYDEAIAHLEQLRNSTKNNDIKAEASYKLAYAYQEKGADQQAIKGYEAYITNYPMGKDKQAALTALNALYVKNSNVDALVQFLKQNNLPSLEESALENSYFNAAQVEFGKKNWRKSIDLFNDYLTRYPNGQLKAQAAYYRGVSEYELGNFTAAKRDLQPMATGDWNDYSEDAVLRLAMMDYKAKNYNDAVNGFEILNAKHTDEEFLSSYRTEYLESLFNTGAYDKALNIAELQIKNNTAIQEQGLGYLYKGKVLIQKGELEQAKVPLNQITTKNLGAISAESKYLLAQILYKQNKLQDAEKTAYKAAQTSSGQEFWIAKDYLLLADILIAQKDYFNAIALLEGMVKELKFDDLKAEANEKLTNAKSLEKQSSKLSN